MVNNIKGLIRSGRVPVVKVSDKLKVPLAIRLALKVVSYMPWPLAETKKYPELVQRSADAGEDITAPMKVGIKKTWNKALMLAATNMKNKGFPPGIEIDLFLLHAGHPHLLEPLVKYLHSTYKVRFFDFSTMAPSLLGSIWYPALSIYARRVGPDDTTYGRGGGPQIDADSLAPA